MSSVEPCSRGWCGDAGWAGVSLVPAPCANPDVGSRQAGQAPCLPTGANLRQKSMVWGKRTELALVILNVVKNLPVGVRVRATDSATLCSLLRRKILRSAQN